MRQRYFWALILGMALSTGMVAKDHGDKDDDHGHGKGNRHNAQRDDDDRDHDGGRWESRNGWEYRSYERGEVPPGWNKGRKTGWGNCNMPPGQAKKYGCNQYRYQGRDYYWYKDDGGRIILRRPTIHAHAGVDIGF
jgi:hypothetical protein